VIQQQPGSLQSVVLDAGMEGVVVVEIDPYRVCMMASANKFLRIYYATVKQYLDSLKI